jgi:GTP-binding protein
MSNLVAIVGRPNVGKSTLFNRLIGERRSIVGDEPGITRDRIYGEVEWAGARFSLIDTVVDARAGITQLDEELAALLRSTGKHVLVAANKTDSSSLESESTEFYQFGFDNVFPISAEQGIGIGELLDSVVELLKLGDQETPQEEPAESRELRLAIVGRPNVGKSSLLNRLLGEDRVIVSPVAGTTRDAIDTVLQTPERKFRLIDTAGIRRKGKTDEMAEKLSVIMARKSLERADVAIVIVDAVEGVTALDANIAGYALEAGCSIIIAVNKWDIVKDKETNTAAEFERGLRDKMKFLEWAPVMTISALTGQRVEKILALVLKADEARNRRIPTSQLNDFFERAIAQPRGGTAPSPGKGGMSRLKVQYLTQVGVRPPTFVVFTSGGKPGLHFSYERYLMNRLREEFDFYATPLRIVEKHKKFSRKGAKAQRN